MVINQLSRATAQRNIGNLKKPFTRNIAMDISPVKISTLRMLLAAFILGIPKLSKAINTTIKLKWLNTHKCWLTLPSINSRRENSKIDHGILMPSTSFFARYMPRQKTGR
jgi:hypothetical protein